MKRHVSTQKHHKNIRQSRNTSAFTSMVTAPVHSLPSVARDTFVQESYPRLWCYRELRRSIRLYEQDPVRRSALLDHVTDMPIHQLDLAIAATAIVIQTPDTGYVGVQNKPPIQEYMLNPFMNTRALNTWYKQSKQSVGLCDIPSAGDTLEQMETRKKELRHRIGATKGSLYNVLCFITTRMNSVEAKRVLANTAVEQRIRSRHARFVCISNTHKNNAKNIIHRFRVNTCKGRIDPVLLFIDTATPPVESHCLYRIDRIGPKRRKPVGRLTYLPWSSDYTSEDTENDHGFVRFRGDRVGKLQIHNWAYNGQLEPGTYGNWWWDVGRRTFVPGTKGRVLMDLSQKDPLVVAARKRYPLV